jgi:peptidoglycan/xylan/chitin deacetylase (PgdA/CDA1 family)
VARIVAPLAAAALIAASASLAPPNRLPHPLPTRRLDVPILMYHRVCRLPRFDDRYRGLTVQPSVFDAQMEWLHAHHFHAISERELFDAREWSTPLPPRPVLITFDDGYRDVLYHAEPVLRPLHMPATAFVISDRVSSRDPSFLTWRELRDLERDGFAIGSHTVHHLNLTTLRSAQARLELTQFRKTLEEHLGAPIYLFSCPAGAEDRTVVRLVRQAGYLLAFTTQRGFIQSAREQFLLHRDEIGRSEGLRGFVSLMESALTH